MSRWNPRSPKIPDYIGISFTVGQPLNDYFPMSSPMERIRMS